MNPRERRSLVAFVRALGVRAARQPEPTVATGVHHGLRRELLQNRLSLNFTYDQTKEINGAISHDGTNVFNSVCDADFAGAPSAVGRNLRGVGTRPVLDREIRIRSVNGFEFEGSTIRRGRSGSRPASVSPRCRRRTSLPM
jgi:hypothetical protein